MMVLHNFLDYHARDFPNSDCVKFGDRVINYGEARSMVNRIANALIRLGLKKGDRVAYLSKNSLEYPLFLLGASKAGTPPVPLNYRLAPPEWKYIIDDAQAKVLFVSPQYAAEIFSIREELETVQKIIVMDREPLEGFDAFYPWIEAEEDTPPDREILPEDDVYQMYTSGTTGHPKGAVLTHAAVTTHIHQYQYRFRREPGDYGLIVAPMYHAAGATSAFVNISTRGVLQIMEDFDPAEVVRALSEDNISHVTLVPAMIQACLVKVPDVAERNFDSLKTISYGASPIALETLRKALDVFKCEFYQGYGMTECCAVLTQMTHMDHQRALAGEPHLLLSAGQPALGTAVKIVDEDGNEVPRGEVGEICGKGPQVMRGYWNLPEATAKALEGGWMHTGDAGKMDDEGFLYIEDRVKDMIISGGENIYPREVENCIFENEAVADCAVIGIPSEKWGEAVAAIVVLKNGAESDEATIIEASRKRIAHFKCPKSVEFVDELPRNATGKVLKRVLREKYWKGQDRGVS